MQVAANEYSNQDQQYHFDVVIIGAGPAGTTCSLALQNSGLHVAILDKASFPRDKVCGDSIPGMAAKVLGAIKPSYAEVFRQFKHKVKISATRVALTSGKEVTFTWKNDAYNCPRMAFDNFLFDLVKKETTTTVFENTEVRSIQVSENNVCVSTSAGHFTAAVVVGCDGAHSVVAKTLADFKVVKKHYAGAVRAYQKNISGGAPHLNEIFFSKRFIPGYFWLFPLEDGSFNIGFGMLSEAIAERKINLKKSLVDFIQEFPELKERFANIESDWQIEGFGLPLGTRKVALSGNRFLLCGDAASLIDPLSGDGIGYAMASGKYAAEHIIAHFPDRRFDAATNKHYDHAIYRDIGRKLKKSTRLLRISGRFPWLLNFAVSFLSKNNSVSGYLKKKL